MSYKDIYNEWLNNPYFDEATKAELQAIKDDEKEIEDRFYMDLEFGTAGLRSYWSRHKPNEYLCCQKGNSGTCKLHQ